MTSERFHPGFRTRGRFIALWGRLFGLTLMLALLAGAAGVTGMIVRGVDAGTIALTAAAVIPAAIALAALVSAPIAVVWLLAARLMRWRPATPSANEPPAALCPRCAYDLTGMTEGTACPECGERNTEAE